MSDPDELAPSLESLARQGADVVALMEGALKSIEARSAELLGTFRQAIHHVQEDSTKAVADLKRIASQGEDLRKAQKVQLDRVDQEWRLDLKAVAGAAGEAHAVAFASRIAVAIAEQSRPSYQKMMEAAKALDQAAKRLAWKRAVILGSVGVGAVVAIAALVVWWVPGLDEIVQRRTELAALDRELQAIDLIRCGPKAEYRCVRVNKSVGPQGPQKDYYAVANKK